jgi:hypothetical protein
MEIRELIYGSSTLPPYKCSPLEGHKVAEWCAVQCFLNWALARTNKQATDERPAYATMLLLRARGWLAMETQKQAKLTMARDCSPNPKVRAKLQLGLYMRPSIRSPKSSPASSPHHTLSLTTPAAAASRPAAQTSCSEMSDQAVAELLEQFLMPRPATTTSAAASAFDGSASLFRSNASPAALSSSASSSGSAVSSVTLKRRKMLSSGGPVAAAQVGCGDVQAFLEHFAGLAEGTL